MGDERPLNFIEEIIEADNAAGRWGRRADGTPIVHTRFPPEPNGYLHIGHAKSICLNYGVAARYSGKFNLRFDDTNPTKEDAEYIEAIIRDVKWLGGSFDEGPHAGGLYFASDCFEAMYAFALELIRKGKAYVCELSAEEVSRRRGTPQVPGTSPFRDRPMEESVRLFEEMRSGKHPDGAMTLRAKIDMGSPNFNLRDPVMYRILHEPHPHAGSAWCLYPMYDWAHGIEDSIEGITHSLCTLEFEDHRPLYDWFIGAINEGRTEDGSGAWGKRIHHSRQIEFAKLRPTYTVLSKRNLLKMVESGVVGGWDDPRMPTLSGMRRRGYPAEAIREFCADVGVTKVESRIDVGRLENAVRDHFNRTAPRAMGVLHPLRLVIENWPRHADGTPGVEMLEFTVNPEDPTSGTRQAAFAGELWIERDDFMAEPSKKFFRLSPGREVRLRYAFFITCTGFERDESGEVSVVRATFDPATRGGDAPDGRKVKGTIHWVSARHAVECEVRLFDRLFKAEEPGEATGNWMDDLNADSLKVVRAQVEPWVAGLGAGSTVQLERLGYFTADPDSEQAGLVLNRTVSLKDSWAKVAGG